MENSEIYLKINHRTYTQSDVVRMSLIEIGDLQAELEIEIGSAKEALLAIEDDNSESGIHKKNCIRKKLNCMHYAERWIASIKKETYLDEYKERRYNEMFVKAAKSILPKFLINKIEKSIDGV